MSSKAVPTPASAPKAIVEPIASEVPTFSRWLLPGYVRGRRRLIARQRRAEHGKPLHVSFDHVVDLCSHARRPDAIASAAQRSRRQSSA